MSRSALAIAVLLLWLPLHLPAQSKPVVDDSADVLVLDHDFAATDELAWVFLLNKQVYRIELSSGEVFFQIRPRYSGTRAPRVYPIYESHSASGSSEYEVHPDQDGEYEIRAVGLGGLRVSTRMRVYRDIRGARRRLARSAKPGWELGIELAGGWHSGFAQSSADPTLDSSPPAGSDIEACFSARNAPGLSRLSMCLFGVGHQSQPGAPRIVWFYTEPRVRLLGRFRAGRSNWDLGTLLRVGLGMTAQTAENPVMLAPGVYLARHIRTSPQGSGWSIQLSYSRAFLKGFARPPGVPGATPSSHRLSFGVGWYR